MLRPLIPASLLVVIVAAAGIQTFTSCPPGAPTEICQALSTATSTPTSTNTRFFVPEPTTTTSTSSPSGSTSVGAASQSNGGTGGSHSTPTSTPLSNAGAATSGSGSGMTSTEKIGVGVGVGVGAAVVIGAAALWFIVRRRQRNTYDSGSPAAQYENQPAMSSGVPALVGAAAIARSRSPSTYARPQTSRSMTPKEPIYATSPPGSQQSVPRTPPRLSLPPYSPEEENLMPGPSGYMHDDVPSPMQEDTGGVSPVSPVSPVDSRPPSPLRDDEKW